jgi:hypothetical protein
MKTKGLQSGKTHGKVMENLWKTHGKHAKRFFSAKSLLNERTLVGILRTWAEDWRVN